MKKVIIMLVLAMGIATANAQENVTVVTDNGSEQPTLTKEVYPQKEADGDLYHGLTKKLTFDRMVPPHGLEVTYDKTVHVIHRQFHRDDRTCVLQRSNFNIKPFALNLCRVDHHRITGDDFVSHRHRLQQP